MDAAAAVASTVSVAAAATVITPADRSVGCTTNGSAEPLVVKDTQVRLLQCCCYISCASSNDCYLEHSTWRQDFSVTKTRIWNNTLKGKDARGN